MSSPSTRDWSLIVLLALIWGATFLLAELALVELSPLWLVLLRVGIAALVLLVVVRVQGVRVALTPVLLVGFLAMGLLNNVVPFTLIFWSQTTIDSSLAAILNATMPFWTVLVAHVATRDERMTPAKITGILLGIAGVAVMIGPSALAGLGAAVLPQLAILLATFSYALASLFGRRFPGPAAHGGGPGPARRERSRHADPGAGERARAGAAGAVADDLGRRSGAGGGRHRARLHPLFPHPGERRRHQPLPGHAAHSGDRRPARRPGSRRAPDLAPVLGHALDPSGSRGDRWPHARALAPQPRVGGVADVCIVACGPRAAPRSRRLLAGGG